MKLTEKEIRYGVLRKMLRRRCWGGKHTSIHNIIKGVPSHNKSQFMKEAKKLINEGIIIAKPTSYGLEVSLNPRKKKEIEEIIGLYG